MHVVVITPLGFGGRGGIDRLMDDLRPLLAGDGDRREQVSFWVSRGQGSVWLSPFYSAAVALGLLWRKVRSRVDVVHINLSQDASAYRKLALAAVCRALRIPYILHLHGSHFHQFWDAASPSLDRALVTLFSGSARTLVLGTRWARYVASKAPAIERRIEIFPTAARDPGTRNDNGAQPTLNIVFSGRHGHRKGVLDLVEALAGLKDHGNWRATLAGDGEIEATRAAAQRLGLSDRVSAPGWISAAELDRVLDEADILALPSRDENLPLSVVEAFARRVAVVCTPVGALPDIVEDGVSGLLVQPGDVSGLQAALRRLVSEPELRRRLGEAARATYEQRLELTAYARRLVETWRAVAAEPVAAPHSGR